jgi:hypothetical protein
MGEKLSCRGRARLSMSSTHGAWKVVNDANPAAPIREVDVQLKIEGAEETGYFLVMAPDGCFVSVRRRVSARGSSRAVGWRGRSSAVR